MKVPLGSSIIGPSHSTPSQLFRNFAGLRRGRTKDSFKSSPLLEFSQCVEISDCSRFEWDTFVEKRQTCLHRIRRVEQLASFRRYEIVEDDFVRHFLKGVRVAGGWEKQQVKWKRSKRWRDG